MYLVPVRLLDQLWHIKKCRHFFIKYTIQAVKNRAPKMLLMFPRIKINHRHVIWTKWTSEQFSTARTLIAVVLLSGALDGGWNGLCKIRPVGFSLKYTFNGTDLYFPDSLNNPITNRGGFEKSAPPPAARAFVNVRREKKV